MTLEEKAAQLGSIWGFQVDGGAGRELLAHGLGQVTRLSGSTSLDVAGAAAQANELQRLLSSAPGSGSPRSCTRRSARA